jgi:molecular chaperone DnaK (HSP70)
MTELSPSNDEPLGAGIDIGTDVSVCALSNGTNTAVVPGVSGPSIPTRLRVVGPEAEKPGVVTGQAALDSADNSQLIKPLPRYQSAGDDVEFDISATELPVTWFLKGAKAEWAANVSQTLESLGWDSPKDFNPESALATPVVTVPGAYTESDRDRVVRAVSAVGFSSVDTVRAPVTIAAADFPRHSEPTQLVVADIGAYWCDLGIVTVNPTTQQYEIDARVSKPNLGRRAFDEALARWVIERIGQQHRLSLEFGEEALAHVRESAHDAINALADDGTADLNVPELTDITLSNGSSPTGVDMSIDMSDASQAFEETAHKLAEQFDKLLEHTDGGVSEVDAVVAAGSGTVPPVVSQVVEGRFNADLRRPELGDIETAAAKGAAVLSAQTTGTDGGSPVVTETPSLEYGIRLLTPEGIRYQGIVSPVTPEKTGTMRVATTIDNQLNGYIEICSRHPLTGEITDELAIEVSDLPSCSAGNCEIEVQLSVDERVEDVTASLADDAHQKLLVEFNSGDNGVPNLPPFAPANTNPENLPTVDHNRSPDGTYAHQTTPAAESFEDTSTQTAINRIYKIRRDLTAMLNEETSVSPSEIETLIRKFDNSLRLIGIEPIEPEVGDERNGLRHQEVAIRPDPHPEGTIAEIVGPGYEIDGVVVESAKVVVSEGPSHTNEQGDNVEFEVEEGDIASTSVETRLENTESESSADAPENSQENSWNGGDEDSRGSVTDRDDEGIMSESNTDANTNSERSTDELVNDDESEEIEYRYATRSTQETTNDEE